MEDSIRRILAAAWDNEISQYFLFVILFVFLFVPLLAFLRWAWNSIVTWVWNHFVIRGSVTRWVWKWPGYSINAISYSIPGLLTTMGLVGTFVGILIGLLDFDVDDIDASVPSLLEGLKIAFVTSAFGIFLAWVWKVSELLFRSTTDDMATDDPARAYRLLEGLKEESVALRQAIQGEEDTSLVSQIQKLRLSIMEGNQNIITALKEFAEEVTKHSVEAIIEALEEVIRDFNEQLSEQFGENFTRFNGAMGQILEWQENNRQQVQELTGLLDKLLEGVQQAEAALTQVAEGTAKIVPVVEGIKEALGTLENQEMALEAMLESVAELGESARNTLPQVEENINRMTKGFSEHVNQSLASIDKLLMESTDTMKSTTREVSKDLSKMTTDLAEHINQSVNSMSEAADDMGDSMRTAVKEYAGELGQISKDAKELIVDSTNHTRRLLQSSIEEFDGEMQIHIKAFIERFDKSMEQEIGRVITALGQRLTAIADDIITRLEMMIERPTSKIGDANVDKMTEAES